MLAYCNNNPARYVDATGNIAQSAIDLDEDDNDILDPDSGGGSYIYANAFNPIDAGYNYGVDLSQAANSSLFGGGLLANGYITYTYHTNLSDLNSSAVSSNNPLENIVYTDKVKMQMQNTDFHGFPLIVDNYGSFGVLIHKMGGDGRIYSHLSIAGSYLGYTGNFVYIWDANRVCNHRCFEICYDNT